MTIVTTPQGLALTVSNDADVEGYAHAVRGYLLSAADTAERLGVLVDREEPMPMALVFRAYLLKLAADPRFRQPLANLGTRLSALSGLSAWEAAHVEAALHWLGDDMIAARDRLEAVLAEFPRDVLALRIAQYLHFYVGTDAGMRDSIARVLPYWSAADDDYGCVLGMYAFGLEESGDYAAAERAGREAVERCPADIWAVHAVTHVTQMQARWDDGIRWVQSCRPGWTGSNNFRYHLEWHEALLHLGRHDNAAALTIYDNLLADAIADDFYLDMCNATSLLWRLDMAGVDTGPRWAALQDLAGARIGDDELVFSSLHYMMASARCGDAAAIAAGMDAMRAWGTLDTTQGSIASAVGLDVAQAIVDIATGDPADGSARLGGTVDSLARIGGSHAQRALFTELTAHYAPGAA